MIQVSNHVFKLSGVLTLLLFLLLSPAITMAATTTPDAIGEVVYMVGTVRATQSNTQPRELELESPVFAGDTVITSTRSQVEIRFTDGTILAQGNDAEISLDEFVYSMDKSASKLLFKMTVGTFRVATGEIVKLNPEAFRLQTPLTVLGIRGTQPFIKIPKKKKKGEAETIGLIDLTPGYTVTVTTARRTVTFNRPGVFTNVDTDGGMSEPAPTPPAVQRAIQRAAPMTSKGELGSRGTKEDLKRKVKAFEKHISREKEDLSRGGDTGGRRDDDGHHDDDGDRHDHPDYGKIHHITVQQKGLKNAKDQKDGKSSAIDEGSSHLDEGHPDDHDDHDDDGDGHDHGNGGNGH